MNGLVSARARPAARKMVIKPLKSRPELPSDYEDRAWADLEGAVLAVQRAEPAKLGLEELYRHVETLCQNGKGSSLWSRLLNLLVWHAGEVTKGLASNLGPTPGAFLETLGSVWGAYSSQLLLTRQIFLYLDRTYVLPKSGERSIYDAGLRALRSSLDAHPVVVKRTVDGLLELVESDRNGAAADRGLAAQLVRALVGLELYDPVLQRPLLERTLGFYGEEGRRLAGELDVPAYLRHVERRLEEEAQRCDAYLTPDARRLLVSAVEAGLLEAHVASLLERGLGLMLEQNQTEELARAYRLCSQIGAQEDLRVAFKDLVRSTGQSRVRDEARDAELVADLLAMRDRLENVISVSFAGNESFSLALKEAFESFVNQRQSKPAELIAKHIDGLMRGQGRGGKGGDDLDASLHAVFVLFRYIQASNGGCGWGKDVFEAFYKKDLAKRLLLNRSVSIDAEKACIARLKAECGAQFTTKLEGMFKDVELSQDVIAGFRESAEKRAAAAAGAAVSEMSAHVLTLGFWPSYPAAECELPLALADAQQAFSDFYLRKHSGRRLAWYNSLGTCVLRVSFRAGPKELLLSLFQAVVMLQFEEGVEALSLRDLAAATRIEDVELRRTLQSLACGRERVLRKAPMSRDVSDDDVFSFNEGYTSKLFRVRVNTIQARESAEENTRTNDQVLQDRQYQIDAAIVRVMKTRKMLSHKLLVNQLMTQLKFPLKTSDLKKRIESLIEREYLERDPRDPNIYNYLA